jgi:hypothetical protein
VELARVGIEGTQGCEKSSDTGIFVFPDGINFQHYGVGWDDSKSGYDMPFFDNMLKSMEADFCVNGKRVFVSTPHSCSAASTSVHSSTNVMTCKSYNSCAKEFVECSFNANIGHTLPPNWAMDTWAFFSSFP